MSNISSIIVRVLIDTHFIKNIHSIHGCLAHTHYVFKHEKMESVMWHREFVRRMDYFGYTVESALVEDGDTFHVKFENRFRNDATICVIFEIPIQK